ncbi:pyridoxal phosphate-dependent decarboxylase family protein [Robiginitalea sp. IMCC44478]|uniref:pyridoxal phosphate-dependent decarboxylase family protein n=1 Tax=Robiginitalea sp. IMCC44478 TaxID=3459122 RepID=UPI0040422F07
MDQNLLQKAFNPDHFLAAGNMLMEQLHAHLQLSTKGVAPQVLQWEDPDKQLAYWKEFMTSGNPEQFFSEVIKRTTHTHHPRYMGHQVSATAPLTALSGMVSALLNNGMAVYEMGMAPSAIEQCVIEALAENMGFRKAAGGLLTSGGTLANLTALLSARKAKASHDVWNEGLQKPLAIMVSEEAHYCIDRAAKIMGLGNKGIIKIPVNKNFALDPSQLEIYYEQAQSEGLEVFAIVGSAPCTATGAYDDLQAIARFAKSKNLWFHVDGAHGGAAIFSGKYRQLLQGIEQADSVVIDGHKMMLMPTITTALIYRNGRHALHTFSQKADYLLSEVEEAGWINSGKKTFECTKTMMSLHWYLLFKVYGTALFDQFLTRQYDLAADFWRILEDADDFEVAVRPMSNIVCFRYVQPGMSLEALDQLNAFTRAESLKAGRYYIVQTRLKGRLYLRTSLMNPFTSLQDLKNLLSYLRDLAKSQQR